MKKQIKKAVESGDIKKVRKLIIEGLKTSADRVDTLDAVRYAVENVPDLFDLDDGKKYDVTVGTVSADFRDKLQEDLQRNFSEDKLSLYTAVCASLAKSGSPLSEVDPPEVKEKEEVSPDVIVVETDVKPIGEGCENLCEATDDDSILTLAESADRLMAEEENKDKKCNSAKMLGYIVMCLGIVAAIVALCVSIKFLLGLGIGVLMIGVVITYLAIQKK